jgi:chromosome segregation ATPase
MPQVLARADALEEEREQLVQSQPDMSQLLGEFYSSVSAAEDAAGMLCDVEVLSASIEDCLASLVPELQTQVDALQIHKVKLAAELQSEQYRVIELEKQLEEQSKAMEKASEECARLSALDAEYSKARSLLTKVTKQLKKRDEERMALLAEGDELRAARDQVPQAFGHPLIPA